MRIPLPAGLATVVGALPQLGPVDASRFVLDLVPRLPAAPGVRLVGDDGALELRIDEAVDAVGAFLAELRGRVEPVALTLTGPVTLQLGLDGGGDPAAGETAVRTVVAVARRLLDQAAQMVPGAPVLLFLEEPGLVHSMHPAFPLDSDRVEELVGGVVEPLTNDAMVGVHVPGRADFAMLFRTGIQVLGAPLGAQLETAAAELARFLEGGGFIAWGAVPVDEPLGSGSERLWRRLSGLWAELTRLGLDPLLLRERSIITPASGLGDFGVTQAERILRLTGELSERVVRQVMGARLSIGA